MSWLDSCDGLLRCGQMVVLALFMSLLALPTQADWLVTANGERIETRGAWKVKGRRVIFTTAAGQLSSIRTSEVDLEASAKATTEAKTPAGEAREAIQETKPVLVLTDRDFSAAAQVGEDASIPGAEPGSEEPDQASETGSADDLRVVDWQQDYNSIDNQLEISGTVRNGGQSLLTNFSINVAAYDESGTLIGRYDASSQEPSLPPGSSSQFRAVIPAVTSIAAVKFDVRSRGFRFRPEPDAEDDESVEDGTDLDESEDDEFEETEEPESEPPALIANGPWQP